MQIKYSYFYAAINANFQINCLQCHYDYLSYVFLAINDFDSGFLTKLTTKMVMFIDVTDFKHFLIKENIVCTLSLVQI